MSEQPGPELSLKPRRHTKEKEHTLEELGQPHQLSSHPAGEEHRGKQRDPWLCRGSDLSYMSPKVFSRGTTRLKVYVNSDAGWKWTEDRQELASEAC